MFTFRQLFTLFLLSVFFISVNSVSQAQVLNVESFRTQADVDTTAQWYGETGFDVTLSKFNERLFKLGNQTNAAYFTGKHRYLFLTNVELINVNGSSVISNGYFHLRGTFLENRTYSPEVFSQFQYNENLGMKERFLTGTSVRYTFLDESAIRGSFVTGAMVEYEKWGTAEQQNVENTFLKSTSSLSIRGQLTETTQLLLIGYYQARPDRFFKPRVISENQLNMRISQRLTFRVNFTLTYDVEPIIDIPNLTYELRNGLVLSL